MKLYTTIISDTHTKHRELEQDLIGGDLLIHCGDVSSRGKPSEIEEFLDWFSTRPYTFKIFIAGNHDFFFQDGYETVNNLLKNYPDIIYLQDSGYNIDGLKIWGSPWQPWFLDWAFNLPRNGKELQEKWDIIPYDTDILITHGPPFGIGDQTTKKFNVGCNFLRHKVDQIRPTLHCFGHIHEGYGELKTTHTTFINGSNLDINYEYSNKPISFTIDTKTKEIT